MKYELKITQEQLERDLMKLILNHDSAKEDMNPEYPDCMTKFKSSRDLMDYFFYNHVAKTVLELHEYEDGRFGFYFNLINKDSRDSYQPIFKCKKKEDVLDSKVISDIMKFLKDHIEFMNTPR